MTPEGLTLFLCILPPNICHIMLSNTLPNTPNLSLWTPLPDVCDQKGSWFLCRKGYKEDKIAVAYHLPRPRQPKCVEALHAAIKEHGGERMTPLLTERVRRIIVPWIEPSRVIVKWANTVFTDYVEPKADQSPFPCPSQSRSVQQVPAITEPQSKVLNETKSKASEISDEGSVKEMHCLIDLEVAELNRRARLDRNEKRQQRRQQRQEDLEKERVRLLEVAVFPEEEDESHEQALRADSQAHLVDDKQPLSDTLCDTLTESLTKKQRARRHRQIQRQRDLEQKEQAKMLDETRAFLRQCCPALEAALIGPVDQTRVQEDPFPEIERWTRRALDAQMRRQRREIKAIKKAATVLPTH
jgi:hypothetical protein